ncbi:MAG: hypothetical protein IJT94_07735 [Oscillibacter sp.]|nr:hypothetical protein [Oscillibacter sp.]
MRKKLLFWTGVLLSLLLAAPAMAAKQDAAALAEAADAARQEERERAEEIRQVAQARTAFLQSRTEEEYAELMAGGASVTITVRLPDGGTANAGDRAYVALCRAAVTDASGRVVSEPAAVRDEIAEFSQGAASASVVIYNVEAGEYVIRVDTNEITGGGVLNRYENYFNADGSPSSSGYTQSVFSVSGSGGVNRTVTLPRAEASISGTLEFSAPLASDTEFTVSVYHMGENYMLRTPGKKGVRSVPFTLGVNPGSYSPYFWSSDSDTWYLSYDGDLSGDYGKQLYFSLGAGDRVTGLSINGDPLLEQGAAPEDAEKVSVTFTVTLPETLTEDREYQLVGVYQRDAYLDGNGRTVWVPAGQNTATAVLRLDKGREYALGYRDMTEVNEYYSVDTAMDARLATADGGITHRFANAKKFRFNADGTAVLQEPACGAVTGMLSRGSFSPGLNAAGYAYAVFPDGTRYSGRVLLGTGDAAPFTIYIPSSRSGQTYQLYAALASGASNRVMEASASKPVSRTFSGSASVGTLTISQDYVTASGSISLPQGVTAPAGGQAVQLELDYDASQIYVIPSGKDTLSFSYQGYPRYDGTSLDAELPGGLPGVFPRVSMSYNGSQDSDSSSWLGNLPVSFVKSAVISGSISLPDGITDIGALFSMDFYSGVLSNNISYSYSAYPNISIRKGENKTTYAITAPVGEGPLSLNVSSSTDGRVSSETLYTGDGGTSSTEWQELHVTGDRSGVDFKLTAYGSASAPAIVSYRASWDEEEDFFTAFRENGWISIKYVGPGTSAKAVAVLRDADGRFLDMAMQDYMTLSHDAKEAWLNFNTGTAAVQSAASVRIFLLDRDTLCPLAAVTAP